MPIHRTPSFDGVDKLSELVAEVEAEGETIVTIFDHGNQWVVVTNAKPKRGRPPAKETRA